jgi:hypothetical protein
MPVLLRDDLTEDEIDQMRLVENIQREDLDPLEEADGFEQLRKKHGYTIKQIAAKITDGRGESYVYKRLALNTARPGTREAMYEVDPLDVSLALLIAGYEPEAQEDVLDYLRGMKARAENRWPTFRVAQEALAKAFNLAIASAPFDTDVGRSRAGGGQLHKRARSAPSTRATCSAATRARSTSARTPAVSNASAKRTSSSSKAQLANDGFKVIDTEEAERAMRRRPAGAIKGFQRLDKVAYIDDGRATASSAKSPSRRAARHGQESAEAARVHRPAQPEAHPVITSELAEKLRPCGKEGAKRGQACKEAPRAERRRAPVDTAAPEEIALDVPDVQRAVLLRVFDAVRNRERIDDEARSWPRCCWSTRKAGK